MGMAQLSAKDQNALKNLCEVLGASFGGPEKVPEARVLEVLKENNMNTNQAFELLELELQQSPWETNSKKEPKKKQVPAPKGKRNDFPTNNAERTGPRPARPANDNARAPRQDRPVPKGKATRGSPTNVAEANSAPAIVRNAPAASQRSALPSAAASSAPSNTISVPAVTGNQWARGPPKAQEPEIEVPASPAPVVVEEPAQPSLQQQAPASKAWGGNHKQGKEATKQAKAPEPAPAAAQAPEHVLPEPAPAHQPAPAPAEQASAKPADTQPAMQEYHQHTDPTASMASLNLDQPATNPAMSTFNAPAGANYGGYGYHGNAQQDVSGLSANTYGKANPRAQNDFANGFQQNAAAPVPQMQNMYTSGLDATNAPPPAAGAMAPYSTNMKQQNANAAFGMDQQDPSAPAGQNSQQSLMYQQQYMLNMMNGYGGFPGGYGNMAAMYGAYGNMSGFPAGYGGMPNNMGYTGMNNTNMNTTNMTGAGGNSQGYTQTAPKHHNNHHHKKHNNRGGYGNDTGYNTGYGSTNTGYGNSPGYGNTGYGNNSPGYGSNVYGNSNGYVNTANDAGSTASMNNMYNLYGGMPMGGMQNLDAGYGQQQTQQQTQQQQQQSFGNLMGASANSRHGNMGSNLSNMYSAKNEVNWAS